MWPGWLAELAQQLTEACGPGMPGPYGEFKDIWAAVVQESLRRCGATSL